MDSRVLCEKIQAICMNIRADGYYRYDPRDISDFVDNFKSKYLRRFVSVALQLGEVINPFIVRNLIGVEKRIYPTTFTFLAESQFLTGNKLDIESDFQLMQQCIKKYYRGKGFWEFKKNVAFFPMPCNKQPSMPLYMLCRCNNLLIRMGEKYKLKELVAVSEESAEYVFRNHIIMNFPDGREGVSYYYNSNECTINVNAELIDWLTVLSNVSDSDKYIWHIISIMKMIMDEQNIDGSWYYYSKYTMREYNLDASIDCHHTASTLYNLIHVYERENFLPVDEKERLQISIKRGMKFFLENFFDREGNGKVIIGKIRKASTVQYAEALIAIGEYIRVMMDDEIKPQCKELIVKIASKITNLIKKDGSAPGDIKITPINLNNINWGNGAALYALCYYQTTFSAYAMQRKRNEI